MGQASQKLLFLCTTKRTQVSQNGFTNELIGALSSNLYIKEKIQQMLDLRHTHCQRTLPTLDDLAAVPHLSYSAFPPERFMQLSSKATGPSAPPKTAGAYQAAQPRSQRQRAATKRSLQSPRARRGRTSSCPTTNG